MLKCERRLRADVKVSEDLFLRVKKKMISSFSFLLFYWVELVLFCFWLFVCHIAFCIPNIVYLNLCHWSNMYNYQSKKKKKRKQKATICYVQYFVDLFFMLFFKDVVFTSDGETTACEVLKKKIRIFRVQFD